MSKSVKKARQMLLEARVPFDPSFLFARNWKQRVAPFLDQMPEMKRSRTTGQKIKGVQMADVLYLPAELELTGDTIILARHLVFSRKHVKIVGHNDLLVFPVESVLSPTDDFQARMAKGKIFTRVGFSAAATFTKSFDAARQQGLLVPPETVSISLDGFGRDQWLELQKTRSAGRQKANHAQSNIDNPPGATGVTGNLGEPGQTPGVAATGPQGNCNTNPDGQKGDDGVRASTAGTGGTGKRGIDGDDGGTLEWTVNPATSFTVVSARGGRGGQGGTGGPGGVAARGGEGGLGGPGASCPCPDPSGTGGRGGKGGPGGNGGDGGDGGPGATGGRGGIINLKIPCNYTGTISPFVDKGGPGPGGEPGSLSAGGPAGSPGEGGNGGSNISCLKMQGSKGSEGGVGLLGEPGNWHGDRGAEGQPGPGDGIVNRTYTGNCGGGGGGDGDPSLEPGPANAYCTPWYWVYYHCEPVLIAGLNSYLSTSRSHHKIGVTLPEPTTYVCVEVDRQYAGCW